MSTISLSQKNSLSVLEQILIAILAGCIVASGVLIAMGLGVQVWFSGRIFPGVSIAGVDLSGLSPQEAATMLSTEVRYPQDGQILLMDGDQTWLVSPAQLGLFLDPETSAASAFEIGRGGNLVERLNTQWNTWRSGKNLTPVFIFDERIAYLQLDQLARQINKPVVEAQLNITGTDVQVSDGQVGRFVDANTTVQRIAALLPTMQDGMIEIATTEIKPYILDASEQADLAKQILSEPLVLTVDAVEGQPSGPWEFDVNTLASMLRIERVQDGENSRFQIGINADVLRTFLDGLAPELQLEPKNARFIFNDDTRELEVIENAIIGRRLNVDGTIQQIQSKIVQEGSHEVPLVFFTDKPKITDDVTAAELGITELVHEETSYFYGSSRDRVQNITVAAGKFHGILVAPGEEFSMASAIGDVSLDNGYAEALIIAGGRTIQGVGGGVCQVSTTLFRAAFFAGFPITERHSHAYRVSYYEKTAGNYRDASLAGLDATVYVPIVDLKFVNDTDNWLLMETYVNPTYSSIVWKFYSTSDGREVNWTTTGPVNTVEPPDPLYKENPDLKEGEIKQVDWAAQGADVTVNRTVTRDGEVILSDTFYTHYRPWQAVYEYGPGTELPEDAKTEGD